MSAAACRRCALGLAGLLLAAATAAASTSDEVAMRRLLQDLSLDSNRLAEDTEEFLRRTWRWEPEGADRELWLELRDFRSALQRVDRLFVDRAYRGMEDDVREVLERGRTLEGQLESAEPDRRVRDDWSRVRRGLQELARVHGWDFDAPRLGSPAPYERPNRDRRDTLRDPYAPAPRRYTAADERTVQSALSQLRRTSGLLASRLAEGPGEDPEDLFKGMGRAVLRDLMGSAGVASAPPREDRLASDLEAFRSAIDEAASRFETSQSAAEVEPEVRSAHRLATGIDSAIEAREVSREIETLWKDVRREMNQLAAVYGLQSL